MSQPQGAVHNRETINLDSATAEQCRALITACEARLEMLEKSGMRQLRENLKQVALARGVPLTRLLSELQSPEAQPITRQRRPAGTAQREREEAARFKMYYDPETRQGWDGHGKAPKIFYDAQTGRLDRKKLEECRNPEHRGWSQDDAAE